MRPPARDGLGERALERGDRGRVDQRTHQRVRRERIADAHLRVRVHQPPLELGGARLVHDQAARRRAALPRRADGAEQHGRHDEVEVGVRGDDERVVARAFEQHAAEAAGHARGDVAADGRRAGERHERDARIVDDGVRVRVVGDREREDRGQRLLVDDAVGERLHGERGERRLRRRLPDDRVAADRGERRVPRPDGDREVERRDDADDAERMPLLVHAVRDALGVHRPAVEHPRLADGEVGDVDHLLHLAVAFGLDLAVLQRDERAERVLVLAQEFREAPYRVAADGRRDVAPPVRCLRGGGEHRLHVGGIRERHVRERLPVGRVDRRHALAAAAPPARARAGARIAAGKTEAGEEGGGASVHAAGLSGEQAGLSPDGRAGASDCASRVTPRRASRPVRVGAPSRPPV